MLVSITGSIGQSDLEYRPSLPAWWTNFIYFPWWWVFRGSYILNSEWPLHLGSRWDLLCFLVSCMGLLFVDKGKDKIRHLLFLDDTVRPFYYDHSCSFTKWSLNKLLHNINSGWGHLKHFSNIACIRKYSYVDNLYTEDHSVIDKFNC